MQELKESCLTCLQHPGAEFLDVHSKSSSTVHDVLWKHFWFTEGDLQQAVLCQTCWAQLNSFHQFYVSVQECYEKRLASLDVNSKPEDVDYYQLDDWEDCLPEQSDNTVDADLKQQEEQSNDVQSELDEIESYQLDEQGECLLNHSDVTMGAGSGQQNGTGDWSEPSKQSIELKQPDVVISESEEFEYYPLEELEECLPEDGGMEQQKTIEDCPKLVEENVNQEQSESKAKQDCRNISDDDYIRKHVRYICDLCLYEGDTFSSYVEHSREVHRNKFAYLSCCGRKFYTKSHLLKHVQMFNDPKLLQNHNNFLKRLKYKQRYSQVTPPPGTKCDCCDHVATTEKALRFHKKQMHDERNTRYHCSQCPKNYSNPQLLKEHVAACHDQVDLHSYLASYLSTHQ